MITTKSFQKSLKLTLCAIVLLGFSACSGDEDDTSDGSNTLTFNGTSYTLVGGFIEDNGAVDPLEDGNPASHYNYVVGVSDAAFQLYDDEGEQYFGGTDGVSVVIYFDIYSDGITSFQEGTFDFLDVDNATPADIAGKSFFANGELELDDDGLAPNGDLDGEEYEIIGGTLTLTGSASDYTIDLSIMLADSDENPAGVAVGVYSGSFMVKQSMD